ncbi:adenylate/guanylate cyclase domain-containing protein [Benzoatithermus flavus]|uniref:Adenylate/guanylate cyclase domain-containing protein n=1 Tax=Benzoatithermus flavus TaxID=3108223 RepID=A0ABU8XTH4_9PROT
MAPSRDERRLAVILVADIAGYARLMEEDEAGTLRRWRAVRRNLVGPLLARHEGRLVKLTGDGFLAEFASVVAALDFALALQEGIAAQEADLPAGCRLGLRIGLHLGEVVVEGEDEDLYGDGVNVAARLEGLAEPGGLVVSGAVFDQLKGALARRFVSLGERHLKHIARPVRAYRLTEEAAALDAEDSRCHRILAEICLHARRFQLADRHSERAVALNPNDAQNAAFRAYVLMFLGRPEESVALIASAIRRDPFHPGWFIGTLGRALHFAGRHEEAFEAYQRVGAARFFDYAYLAACCHRLGRTEEAASYVARTLEAKPDFAANGWLATLPFRHEADRKRFRQEMLAAGLPP